MKILHVSYSCVGGIGDSVGKLVQAQRTQGLHVEWIFLTTRPLWDSPWSHPLEVLKAAIDQYVLSSGKHSSPVSVLRGSLPSTLKRKLRKAAQSADVVHLHGFDLHGLDFEVLKGKKVLLSLHDFRPASGACHQPAECTNFRISCQNCPAVREFARWAVEKRAVTNTPLLLSENVHLVVPSRWMGDLVGSRFTGQTKTISVLPNISREVRTPAHIPRRESVLIVSSTAPSTLRKLSQKNLSRISALARSLEAPLISVGANSYSSPTLNRGVLSQAELEEEIIKARVLVVPSRWESFSQIAATAIKLQTPVCSFKGGAVEEMAGKYGLFLDLESTDLTRDYLELEPQEVPSDLFSDGDVLRTYRRILQLPEA